MKTIEIDVASRVATLRGSPEIINGNSDYFLAFHLDSEWDEFDSIDCMIIMHTIYGDSTKTIQMQNNFVSLPILENTYGISVGLTAGNVITTTSAFIQCIECITDGDYTKIDPDFDVYNAMMQYIADKMNGSATEEELSAQYQAIVDYMSQKPDGKFPSDAYRVSILENGRTTKLTGSITLKNGTTIEISESNILSDSVEIQTDCMNDDYILPGGVPSSELSLTLLASDDPDALYSAEISLSFWILLYTGKWYEVPLGKFTISEIDDDSEQGYAITSYDFMRKLEQISISELGIESGRAYYPQEIIELCANSASIPYSGDVSNYVNGNVSYVLSNMDNRTETVRDLLMYAVQTICAFAYIDRHGELQIVQLTRKLESDITITSRNRTSIQISRKQYQLYKLHTVYNYPTEDGATNVATPTLQTLWSDGLDADLSENPLWAVLKSTTEYRPSEIRRCMTYILNRLDPIVYTPISCDIYGDPTINPYDWIGFSKDGVTYISPITSYQWRYRNEHHLEACGKDAVAGLAKTQAEKASIAERVTASEYDSNFTRTMYLDMIRSSGHAAMAQRTHEWLAHFTHGELSGEE